MRRDRGGEGVRKEGDGGREGIHNSILIELKISYF